MAKSNYQELGRWSFILGLILAILAGFINVTWLPVVLFVLGLIVGFLNVASEQSTDFLVALIALLLVGTSVMQISMLSPEVSETFSLMLNNFVSFIAAAGLVVAIKSVLAVAAPKFPDHS
jgi:fructose-specific phosphotransferase system IIC component